MTKSAQLSLDLGRPPSFTALDFLPSPCNRAALDWILRWPDWPATALALAGPAGCGKSHLAHIFAANTACRLIAARDITRDIVPDLAGGPGVVVEDADLGVDETALFHLYNRLREQRRPLLVTGRDAPARWPLVLPDLRSRLASLPLAVVLPPDDVLLEALLVKLFADRQLRIPPDVIAYMLPRMERSFAAVRALVGRLDQAALEAGRAVTVPLVRSVLG